MIGTATQKIEENLQDEFTRIRKDIQRHVGPDVTVDHARTLLAQHVPVLVVGSAQILLDSLLNYLMEDAVRSLVDEPTDVKNAFYALDIRTQIKSTFSLVPQNLKFSFDSRIIYGGVAAGSVLLAGRVVALFLSTVFPPVMIGIGSIVASAVVFRAAYSAGTETTRRTLKSGVATYLEQSEAQVKEWLGEVARAFDEAFGKYASQYSIHRRDAS